MKIKPHVPLDMELGKRIYERQLLTKENTVDLARHFGIDAGRLARTLFKYRTENGLPSAFYETKPRRKKELYLWEMFKTDWEAGLTFRQICEKHGKSHSVVANGLKRGGIVASFSTKPPEEQAPLRPVPSVEEYGKAVYTDITRHGKSRKQVAADRDLTLDDVRRVFIGYGLKVGTFRPEIIRAGVIG